MLIKQFVKYKATRQIVALYASVFFCHQLAAAVEVAFQGEGVLEVYTEGHITSTYSFAITVKDCNWDMKLIPGVGSIQYFEESCDGESVYHYVQYLGKAPSVVNSSGSVIAHGQVPLFNFPYSIPIWLAYGSSCYFQDIKGGEAAPFLNYSAPDISELKKDINIDWRVTNSLPIVPAFIYSKELRRSYYVNSYTNIGGLSIPKEFSLTSYRRGIDDTNVPPFQMKGVLTRVEKLVTVARFQPKLDGATYTDDRRFAGVPKPVQQLLYLNTSKVWLNTNNPSVIKAYQKRLGNEPPAENVYAKERMLPILLLIAPTVIFVGFVFFRLRRSRSQNV